MELIQLLSFYQIVKTGSFSQASKNIFRSQSAVSHQIRNLEEEFGVKLFERLGRKVKLTDEGEILCTVIGNFLDDLENVKRIYADMHSGSYGRLTFVISRNLMTYWFTDVIRQFIDRFPGIKYKLYTLSDTAIIQEMILNGEIDFGIGYRDQLISRKLDFLLWRVYNRIIMAHKEHPLCGIKEVSLADIAQYPLILTRLGGTKKVVQEAFSRHNIPYEIIMEVDSPEIIKKFLEKGDGISIFSSIAVTRQDQEKMAVFDVRHLFGQVEYGIYYARDKYVSRVMKQFISSFAPELAPHFSSPGPTLHPPTGADAGED